jgi:hypothetical protein
MRTSAWLGLFWALSVANGVDPSPTAVSDSLRAVATSTAAADVGRALEEGRIEFISENCGGPRRTPQETDSQRCR